MTEAIYICSDSIATMNDFDLGFITALIEGEGEVNIGYSSSRGKDGKICRYVLLPRISISNFSLPLIEKAQNILAVGAIRHTKGTLKPKRKPLHQLMIVTYEEADKVIKMVLPYAIGKKRQFEILQEFVQSRMQRSKNYRGKFPYLIKPPYNERELELFKLIKQENNYQGKGYGTWENIYAFKKEMIPNGK